MNRRQILLGAAAAAGSIPGSADASIKGSAMPLWKWSATDLAEAIRARKITSREATASALQRVASVNGRLNAIVEHLDEEALAAADNADRAVRNGEPLGLLHGVPVTTKINVDYKGHATTDGAIALKDNIALEDSSPVRNLRRAGAVIIGRTNVPTFSSRWFTENDLYGRTFNPWSRAITPGGSSGGASSAVASGMGALAHGNDIAGSVRYPAYACGVTSIRPSMGRVPARTSTGKSLAQSLFLVEGVLGRTVADIKLGFAALAADDPGDPWWTPAPLEFPGAGRPTRVALYAGGKTYRPDASVGASLDRAAKALRDAGYMVDEVDLPHFEEAANLWFELAINEDRQPAGASRDVGGDRRLNRMMDSVDKITPVLDRHGFATAIARRNAICAEWDLFFQHYPLVLLPNSWVAPFEWEHDQVGPEGMREVLREQSPQLVTPLLGVPGLSVPTGLVSGIPSGVQLLARRFREDRCFVAASIIERAHPMPTPVDPV